MRPARAPAVALAFAASVAVGAEPPPAPAEPDAQESPEPEAAAAGAHREPWTVLSSRPVLIRSRARPGTRVREVWASAMLSAPAELVQETLLDGENFPRFMP